MCDSPCSHYTKHKLIIKGQDLNIALRGEVIPKGTVLDVLLKKLSDKHKHSTGIYLNTRHIDLVKLSVCLCCLSGRLLMMTNDI